MRPIITKASQLDEHSSWRKYIRGLQELIVMEAPQMVIEDYKNKAARDCFLAFCDLMKKGDLKVVAFHEIIREGPTNTTYYCILRTNPILKVP